MPQACLTSRPQQRQSHTGAMGLAIPGFQRLVPEIPRQPRMVWTSAPTNRARGAARSTNPLSLFPEAFARRQAGGEGFARSLSPHTLTALQTSQSWLAHSPLTSCLAALGPSSMLPPPAFSILGFPYSLPHRGLPHPWAGLGPSYTPPLSQPLRKGFSATPVPASLPPPPPHAGFALLTSASRYSRDGNSQERGGSEQEWEKERGWALSQCSPWEST